MCVRIRFLIKTSGLRDPSNGTASGQIGKDADQPGCALHGFCRARIPSLLLIVWTKGNPLPGQEEGFVSCSNCGATEKDKPLSMDACIDTPRLKLRAMVAI
jgi:hypothetical protein